MESSHQPNNRLASLISPQIGTRVVHFHYSPNSEEKAPQKAPGRLSTGTLTKTKVEDLLRASPVPSSSLSALRFQNERFRTKCTMLSNEVSRKTHEIEALRHLLLQEKEKMSFLNK
eukprot:UN24062